MEPKTLTRLGMDITIKQYDPTYTILLQTFDIKLPNTTIDVDEIILNTSEIPDLIEKLQEYYENYENQL